MTVSSVIYRNDYVGSGITGPYSYTFRLQVASDLEVVTRNIASGVETTLSSGDYTITGVGTRSGGTITLATALATGNTLTLIRVPPLTQLTNLRNQGRYFPADVEDGLDRLVMQLQGQSDVDSRTMALPVSVSPLVVSPVLPPPVASNVLIWNSSATALQNGVVSTSSIVLPGEGRTTASATAYLANNAVYNLRDWGAVGDGVTDDTSAVQACYTAARVTGGVVVVPHGRFKLTAPVNLTDSAGNKNSIITRGEGGLGIGTAYSQFLIAHNGHAFDLSGSVRLVFENMSVISAATFTPQTAFFMARSATAGGAGLHRFLNCNIYGTFSQAIIYSYGSEENAFDNCWFQNDLGHIVCLTGNNILSLFSTLIAIPGCTTAAFLAHVSESNIVHRFSDCSFYANSTTGHPFYLDAVGDLIVRGTWMAAFTNASSGSSLVYTDLSIGASVACHFDHCTGENNGALSQVYGFEFSNHAQTVVSYSVTHCRITSSTFAFYAPALVSFVDLDIQQLIEYTNKGISIAGGVSRSFMRLSSTIVAVGASSRNTLILDVSRTTLGSTALDTITDINTGNVVAVSVTAGTIISAIVGSGGGATPLVLKNGGTTVGTLSPTNALFPATVTGAAVVADGGIGTSAGGTPLLLKTGATTVITLTGTLATFPSLISAAGLPGAPGASGTLWVDGASANVVKRVP